MSTYGILLPCDGSEPMPISVGDYKDIQSKVGGLIDAVFAEMNPTWFELEGQTIELVGYVDDEGIIKGLPINSMASIVFQRELYGPVVLVSATSPSGDNDGENYDIPEWFADAVFCGGLFELSKTMRVAAVVQANAVKIARADGMIDDDQWEELMEMMDRCNEQDMDKIDRIVNLCLAYVASKAMLDIDIEEVTISDEDIAKFWEQEGGN